MSQIYTFSTTLLSAQKTGNPNMTTQPLSALGVNTISLSTNDVGISFVPNGTLTGTLILTTVQGSRFRIDSSYHHTNSEMILLKNDGSGTIFRFASGGSVGVALSANYRNFTTSETRRKSHLGYR
jgi:hypothetical protein